MVEKDVLDSSININGDEVTASDTIDDKLKIFSQHVIISKFPNCIDGLKNVHRRILYVLRNDTGNVKTSAISGRLVEKYHPSGELSIDKAIKRMSQGYNNIVPLLYPTGNIGSYGNSAESAAARYLEMRLSDFAKDVYYRNINPKTWKFVPTETGDDFEPAYFIPKIPMALMSNSFTIGIGDKSDIPSLSLSNLCDLTIAFIKNNFVLSKDMYKYLIPDFPIESFIRNKKDLLKSYSDTSFENTIVVDGVLNLTPNSISIRTIPYGKIYVDNCDFNIKRLLLDKNSFISKYVQRIGNYSKEQLYGDTVINLKRGVNPFTILNELKKKIGFAGKYYPKMFFVSHNQKQIKCNHFLLLHLWYKERYRSILTELKHKQNSLLKENRELHALLICLKYPDEITSIFRKSENVKSTYGVLNKKYGLSGLQCEYIGINFSVNKLTKFNSKEIKDRIDKNKLYLHNLQFEYGKINDKIVSEIEYIKNKYVKDYPIKSKFNNFIGYINYANQGIIQFRNLDEYKCLIKDFNNSDITIHLYAQGKLNKFILSDGNILDDYQIDHPKEFPCYDFRTCKNIPKHTISLANRTICRFNGLVYKQDKNKYIFVDDDFITIDKKGMLKWEHYSNISLRKILGATGLLSNIIHVDNFHDNEGIVFYANIKEPNIVRIGKVYKGVDTKLIKSPLGKLEILGIYNSKHPLILPIPTRFLYKCKVSNIYIKNPLELINQRMSKFNIKKLDKGMVDATHKNFKF